MSDCQSVSVVILFSVSMFQTLSQSVSFNLSLSLYLCQYVFVILCLCHSVDRHVPQLGLLPLLLMLYLWVHEMAMWLQRISAITEKMLSPLISAKLKVHCSIVKIKTGKVGA